VIYTEKNVKELQMTVGNIPV